MVYGLRMEIDKSQAIAIAAFARFDGDVTDPLLRGVSAAYCLIACADGDLDDAELREYVALAQTDAVFEKLDRSKLATALRTFAEALQTDVQAGRTRALELVREVGKDAATRTLLLDAAKLAMKANANVTRSEIGALRDLCMALGVNPRDHLPED